MRTQVMRTQVMRTPVMRTSVVKWCWVAFRAMVPPDTMPVRLRRSPATSRTRSSTKTASRGLARLALALGLALSPAALPSAAWAQTHADDTARAKELFQQGTTLFDLGEFDKAIEAWQQGYKEKPDPGFLYNIGQAYRLKGDSQKAIFFYRGYLRNSPKAANRADIEAKIAALQKSAGEPKPATPAAPVAPPASPVPVAPAPVSPTPVAPPPAPVWPTPVAPPPVAAPPLAGPAPAPIEPPAPMSESPAPAAGKNRPIDVAVGIGFDKWTSGLNIKGGAPAQFAFALGAGYTLGGDVFGASSFRLGAYFDTTTLQEGSGTGANKLSFTSLLAEPSVRLRLVDRRLYLTGGLGLGALFIGGVKATSVVVAPNQIVANINPGAITTFSLRPALALQVHFTPGLVGFVSPALSYAVKPKAFYQALDRVELMFGLAYLL
jgi:hypothetical protein